MLWTLEMISTVSFSARKLISAAVKPSWSSFGNGICVALAGILLVSGVWCLVALSRFCLVVHSVQSRFDLFLFSFFFFCFSRVARAQRCGWWHTIWHTIYGTRTWLVCHSASSLTVCRKEQND